MNAIHRDDVIKFKSSLKTALHCAQHGHNTHVTSEADKSIPPQSNMYNIIEMAAMFKEEAETGL